MSDGARPFPVLETARLRLRELKPSDATSAVQFYTDPDVMRYYDALMHGIDEVQATISAHRRRWEHNEAVRWGIALKGDERVIGTCGIYREEFYVGRLSYVLARPYWGQGLMVEALAASIGYGFERYGLHRLEAQVVVVNVASQRVLEKLGFRQEGLLRERYYVDGRYHDEQVYGLLAREWFERSEPELV